jgi:hypothetical protein
VRRGIGRGRLLIGIGATLAIVAMPMAWFTVGGQVLPAVSGSGFDGAGVVTFVAAVGMLALIVLPYASRTGHSSLDRPASFAALLAIGVGGLLVEAWELLNADPSRLGWPDRAPGLWLASLGMLIAAWGVGELLAERSAEP